MPIKKKTHEQFVQEVDNCEKNIDDFYNKLKKKRRWENVCIKINCIKSIRM